MRFNSFLTVASARAFAVGAGCLLAPEPVLAQYAIPAEAADMLMSRFFGAALVYLSLVSFLAWRVTSPEAQWGLVLGGIVGSPLVGLAVALWAQHSGAVNALGWSTVVIYLVLAVGYGAFLAARGRAT